jgi:hypothetical protein
MAAAPRSACLVGASPDARPDSLTVAVGGTVDAAHLGRPTSAAERFVFAQAYETMIGVDCAGQPYPRLARSWTIDPSRARVTLQLREEARFHDGTPLSARDVIEAWRATGSDSSVSGRLARRLADAATAVDDRTLLVSLPDTAWLVLADPALAVYRPRAGAPGPDGSGPYRVEDSAPGVVRLTPSADGAPRLVVHASRDADLRDAIDAGADVVLTADRPALEYASTRSDLVMPALPWTRAYLFLVPDRSALAVLRGDSADVLRSSLARDVVRADARPAAPPFWWSDARQCMSNVSYDYANTRQAGGPRSRRVVYPADDRVGRELAERVVALASHAVAAPMPSAELTRALRAGTDLAYVVALERQPLAPCEAMIELVSSAPWLAGTDVSDVLIAAVDTRARAILRRDRVALAVDRDGTARVATGQERR